MGIKCGLAAIDWQWPLIGGLIWLVFGLSVTAILLLLYMIKHGESAKVASYFYLVPGLTAIEAWVLFNETLPPIWQIITTIAFTMRKSTAFQFQ